jgi:hypothetical protein
VSRDDQVRIPTMQGAGRSGVRILVEARHFFPQRQERLWGPPTLPLRVYRGSFPVVERLGRYVNHSPPSRFGVKNEWSYTSTLSTCLHSMDKENFTFYVYLCSFLYLSSLIDFRLVHFFLYRLATLSVTEKNLTCRSFPVGTGFENASRPLP